MISVKIAYLVFLMHFLVFQLLGTSKVQEKSGESSKSYSFGDTEDVIREASIRPANSM